MHTHLAPEFQRLCILCKKLQIKHLCQPADIIVFDEKLAWSNMVSDTPMDVVGKNTVRMKTTEHKTCQLTVGLSASLSNLFTYFSLMQTIPCTTSSACA